MERHIPSKALDEIKRIYYYPYITDRDTVELIPVEIEKARELIVSESESHKIITENGRKKYSPPGWVMIEIETNNKDWVDDAQNNSEIFEEVDESRTYTFPFMSRSGKVTTVDVSIKNITEIYIRKSGYHRLKTIDGKFHIIASGWLHIDIQTDKPNWK